MVQFPKDFLWGVACASFQCEGAWDADGKGPSIWDDFCHEIGGDHVKNGDTGDVACDCYHRAKEDVALMKSLNVQAYRFSISWPRVIPDGDGAVNPLGFKFYDELVDELLANGIRPLITLYHWDLPSALQYKGGWLNRDIVAAFERYARVVAEHFKGRVDCFMTLNEPQCAAYLGYGNGLHAPGWKLGHADVARALHHMVLAHSAAQRAIKAVSADISVGVVSCGGLCYPRNDTPAGREAARRATFDLGHPYWAMTFNFFLDDLILRRCDDSAIPAVRAFVDGIPAGDYDLMETPDFIGMNIYNARPVDDDAKQVREPVGSPRTATDWPVTPEALYYGPMNVYKRYGLPIWITEDGLSNHDMLYLDGKVHDPKRIEFLHRYLTFLGKAVAEGVPVKAYLHWSFLDNFEWSDGYDQRFGIVFVDYATLRRVPKDSAWWYASVIATNGESLNDVPKYIY